MPWPSKVGIDLGVREHDELVGELELGEPGERAVHRPLVALLLVVAHDLHSHPAHLLLGTPFPVQPRPGRRYAHARARTPPGGGG